MNTFSQTVDFIKGFITEKTPEYAIVLGSGLGSLVNEVKVISEIPYSDIPGFPESTVKGHGNKLIYGTIEGKHVLMQTGRFHYYEGNSMQKVTYPIRIFHLLGIKNIILSNASGGVNPDFEIGDIMVMTDHINLFPEHPLRGKNLDEFGPRFPDMSSAYDKEMIAFVEKTAKELNIKIQKGVYLGLQGPTFETPSEYGMVYRLGGDAVGMSTVPEVIVARHQGMRVLAFSVISDLGGENIAPEVSHEEVLEAVNKSTPNVVKLVKEVISKGNF